MVLSFQEVVGTEEPQHPAPYCHGVGHAGAQSKMWGRLGIGAAGDQGAGVGS